jgi:hypothetical protein
MNSQRRRAVNVGKVLQALFYALFVVLWFKDNFPLLRNIPVSPVIPFSALVLVLGVRGFVKLRASGAKFRLKIGGDWAVPVMIILLVTLVRIPFLAQSWGTMDSDEAISTLQGKHIAEGKLPALHYYGAFFQGSLTQHYYALLFKIFGYSIFLAKLGAYLAFVAFLIVQVVLFRSVFSREFALAAGMFYVLPFRYLITVSLDVASGYTVVFMFAALIFLLTYLIYEKEKDGLKAPLGFLMGLSFWTHEISVIFILAAAVFLILRYRLRVKPYLILGLYFILGALPVLLSEITWKFPILRMLFGGEGTWTISGSKVDRGKRLLLLLFSSGPVVLGILYLVLLAIGLAVLIVQCLTQRRSRFAGLFAVNVIVFAVVYLLSSYSSLEVIRYFYILYIVLPVVFVAAVFWIRPRPVRWVAVALIYFLLFVVSSRNRSFEFCRLVEMHDRFLHGAVAAIKETGIRYWMGDYWTAYNLTAVSGEKIIVDSFETNRYPPYRLSYFNESRGDSFVFLGTKDSYNMACARNLSAMLLRLGIPFEKKRFEGGILFYDIESPVCPAVIWEEVPSRIPRLETEGAAIQGGYLRISFKTPDPEVPWKFQLRAEIPGYSAVVTPFARVTGKVTIAVPCPAGRPFLLRYGLEYKSLNIPSSVRELSFESQAPDSFRRTEAIVHFRGISTPVQRLGREVRYCEKETVTEINLPEGGARRLRLVLNSPFNFSDAFWYGEYRQHVRIRLESNPPLERDLQDGPNIIDVDLAAFGPGRRTIQVAMDFRYHSLFEFANLRRIAAILETCELVE